MRAVSVREDRKGGDQTSAEATCDQVVLVVEQAVWEGVHESAKQQQRQQAQGDEGRTWCVPDLPAVLVVEP